MQFFVTHIEHIFDHAHTPWIDEHQAPEEDLRYGSNMLGVGEAQLRHVTPPGQVQGVTVASHAGGAPPGRLTSHREKRIQVVVICNNVAQWIVIV